MVSASNSLLCATTAGRGGEGGKNMQSWESVHGSPELGNTTNQTVREDQILEELVMLGALISKGDNKH